MKKLTQTIENTLNKKIIIAFAASAVISFLFTPIIAHADAPSISTFLQNEKVKTALGWASIVIALTFIVAIIIGLIKVVPVAMAFWKRRDGIDQGSEVSKGYLIGWGLLIVVPTVIIGVSSLTFGQEIVDAITTAVSTVFK